MNENQKKETKKKQKVTLNLTQRLAKKSSLHPWLLSEVPRASQTRTIQSHLGKLQKTVRGDGEVRGRAQGRQRKERAMKRER